MARRSFNIASHARVAGPGGDEFAHPPGDTHRYVTHLDQARQPLNREPKSSQRLRLDSAAIEPAVFRIKPVAGHAAHPSIKAPIAA